MKFLNKPNDNFFYFFGIYSVLFLFFNFINSLAILEVLTYIGFTAFFSSRLYDYFIFVKEHKSRIDTLPVWDWKNELSRLVNEAEENTREGTIIILITFCVFVAFFLLGKEPKYEVSETPTYAGAEVLEAEKVLETQNIPIQIIEENEEEILATSDDTNLLANDTDWSISQTNSENLDATADILLEKKEELAINSWEENVENSDIEAVEEDPVEEVEIVVEQEEITGNLIKEGSDGSLALWRNFDVQVKDVYNLQPFTKNGSSFLNVLQLQRVLNKLWYYSWVADWVFNFETKLAIYNALVRECRWPAATTTWVFWAQAKSCIDNLYIVVQDFETEWLPE